MIMSSKKTKVLEVATELFAKHGFENTSVSNICNEADVSKGLVYHHFKSKEAILLEIFSKTTNQMVEMSKSPKSTLEPTKQILQLIDAVISQIQLDKQLFHFNLNMMFQPKTRKLLNDQIELRAALLFESVKSIFNQISEKNSEVLTYMFIAEIDGISLSYLSSYKDYSLMIMKNELLKKYSNIKNLTSND